MAICWKRTVPLAFYLCCFNFSAVLVVFAPRAGCGIRLYRFLIIAFLSTFHKKCLIYAAVYIIGTRLITTLMTIMVIKILPLSGLIDLLMYACMHKCMHAC